MQKKTKKVGLKKMKYSFKGRLWKDHGPAGWCFVTIPAQLSKKIRQVYFSNEEGWGRLKTKANIGATIWNTSIWFDSKFDSYLLPVKTLIRKKEKLAIGSDIKVIIEFDKVSSKLYSPLS